MRSISATANGTEKQVCKKGKVNRVTQLAVVLEDYQELDIEVLWLSKEFA